MTSRIVVMSREELEDVVAAAVKKGMDSLRPLITRAATVWLEEAEAASLYALPVKQLRQWRRKGEGPAYRELDGRVAYAVADLDAFFKAYRVAPATEIVF